MRRPKSLTEIYHEHLSDSEPARDLGQQQLGPLERTDSDEETSAPAHDIDLDDQALIEKARSAANGDNFDALWHGSTDGYDSHSEADMALVCHLAFWTAGDASRMDDLFRQSRLIRPKWDDPHYADGSTYGQKTIERALRKVTTYYDPEQYTTESTSPPTIDELLDALDDDDPASSHDQEQERSAGQMVDTAPESASDAERATTESSPEELDQSVDDPTDLAAVVAEQQATIDALDQRLVAQQQTIDELHASIETIQARLDQRTQATDEEPATDSDDASDF